MQLLAINSLHPLYTSLQKQKDCFNPGRVISVADSVPNNVHASKSNTLLITISLQFQ